MKITLLISSLSGGGAERVVCNLANFLSEHGHEVTVMAVSDQKTYELNDDVHLLTLYREGKSSIPHFLINLIRIYRMNTYFRKKSVDVYITFLPKLTKMILFQRRFINCPIIVAERCDPNTFYNKSPKNKKTFEKYYNLADGYVFQTEDAKDFYKTKGINVQNSAVIPNAINREFLNKEIILKRKKRIIAAGRLTEQKNFSLLIKAFSKIADEFPEYTLVIYGDGSLRKELEQEVNELGLNNKVELPGFVNNLNECIRESTLFVLSSNYEGMPNALMEAMAVGLPVISTDCPAGGSRFLIENNKNGILVDVNDVVKMADALRYMLENPQNALRMGINASKLCERLNPETIYAQWENYISGVVSSSHRK